MRKSVSIAVDSGSNSVVEKREVILDTLVAAAPERQNQFDASNDQDSSEEDDFKIKRVEEQKFLNLHHADLHSLAEIFNSYATKKTFATSFFNLALIATNFTQLKQIIDVSATSPNGLSVVNIIVLLFVCISLVLQFAVGVVLVLLAKKNEFIDLEKREELIRSNNVVTLLIITISIINVFINVFLNV
jgi:hypothetical protein